jgi:hypothetical protein
LRGVLAQRNIQSRKENSMSESPSSAGGNHNAGGRLISQIREGMDVEDVAGEHVGKVAFARIGDPSAIDVELGDASIPGEFYSGEPQEPNVVPTMVRRLLVNGYLKIDDIRRLRRDHHYYALADDVASVEGNTVRLGKPIGELLTPYAP